jgi:hypothetical protein
MLQENKEGKITILSMIREFVDTENSKATDVIRETKELTEDDKTQLGSALARHYSVPENKLTFQPVEY